MRYLTGLSLLSLLTFQCHESSIEPTGCPADGIQTKIAELQAKPKGNPAYEVWAYKYQGRRVYLVTSSCCDQYITLYDACLNVLCAPSGGLTGHGDGGCPQFYQEATDKQLVWRDPR
ncbi:MAG: hypothetical protein EOO56_22925 [Hymenobacter sp.]|nr:MAG: hypothetical protein EOO56_22925 [Hymenobacter sp.]